MAISPASLVSSAALLQDVKNTQTNKTSDQKANQDAFKIAVDKEQSGEKSASVAVEIKTQEASKTSHRVDIKINDDDKAETNQPFNAVAANREAPLPSNVQAQRPGSNLDITV